MRLGHAIQTHAGAAGRAEGGQAHRDHADPSATNASSFGGVLADVTAGSGEAATTKDQTPTAPSATGIGVTANASDPLLLAQALAAAAQGDEVNRDSKQGATGAQQPQAGAALAKSAKDDAADQSGDTDKSAPTRATETDATLGILAMFLAGPAAAATANPATPSSASARNASNATPASGTAAAVPASAIPESLAGAVAIAQIAVQTHLSPGSDPSRSTAAAVFAPTTPSTTPRVVSSSASSDRATPAGAASSAHEVTYEPASTAAVDPTAVAKPSAVDKVVDTSLPPRRDTAPIVPVALAVMPGTSPVQTIAGAIADLATRAASASVATQPTTTAIPVAQTMTLQLSPANLGTVDIRMHMSGDGLDVELTLSDSQTYGLVSRDRDDLAAALGNANYSLQSLTIQDGATSSTGGSYASSSNSPGGEPRSDSSAGGSGSGQSDGGGRGKNRDEGRSSRFSPTQPNAVQPDARRGGGSPFV